MRKQFNYAIKSVLTSPAKATLNKFYSLTYFAKLTECLTKYFTREKDLKIAFKTTNTLGKQIKNNKSRGLKGAQSGVYKLECGTCICWSNR